MKKPSRTVDNPQSARERLLVGGRLVKDTVGFTPVLDVVGGAVDGEISAAVECRIAKMRDAGWQGYRF